MSVRLKFCRSKSIFEHFWGGYSTVFRFFLVFFARFIFYSLFLYPLVATLSFFSVFFITVLLFVFLFYSFIILSHSSSSCFYFFFPIDSSFLLHSSIVCFYRLCSLLYVFSSLFHYFSSFYFLSLLIVLLVFAFYSNFSIFGLLYSSHNLVLIHSRFGLKLRHQGSHGRFFGAPQPRYYVIGFPPFKGPRDRKSVV